MRHKHIWAAGRLSRRGRGHALVPAPCVPQLALGPEWRETKRESAAPTQQAQQLICTKGSKRAGPKERWLSLIHI
eukprot:6832668-Pyramimonas_sp.AAC.1